LKAAGWGVVEGSRVRREYPIAPGRLEGSGGRRGKSLTADYILVYRNTKLGVIEAKASEFRRQKIEAPAPVNRRAWRPIDPQPQA